MANVIIFCECPIYILISVRFLLYNLYFFKIISYQYHIVITYYMLWYMVCLLLCFLGIGYWMCTYHVNCMCMGCVS